VNSSGVISTLAGDGSYGFAGDCGPAASAQLGQPYDVAVDAAGNLYFSDLHNLRVRKITPAALITTVAGDES
jgi:hypothetical protein